MPWMLEGAALQGGFVVSGGGGDACRLGPRRHFGRFAHGHHHVRIDGPTKRIRLILDPVAQRRRDADRHLDRASPRPALDVSHPDVSSGTQLPQLQLR